MRWLRKVLNPILTAVAVSLTTPTASAVTLPYTFSASTGTNASQVNANFSTLRDAFNAHESTLNAHNSTLESILQVNNSCGSTPIDFNLTQALNLRVELLASDPTCNTSNQGRLIFNTSDILFKICDGTSFVSIAGTGVNTLSSVLNAGNSAGAFDINLNGNELQNALAETVTGADPPAGSPGRFVYRTDTFEFKVDNGSNFVALGGSQNLAGVLATGNSAGANDLDMNQREILNLRLEQSATNPVGPVSGEVYYNTASQVIRYYNGSVWSDIGGNLTLAQVLSNGNTAGASSIDFNLNPVSNFRLQNAAGTPATGNAGFIWYETGDEVLKYNTVSADAKEIVSLDDSQTLTNKTIDGDDNTIQDIPDSALSANVNILNGAQTISGAKTYSTAPTISRIIGGGAGTIGHLIPNVADSEFILANGGGQTLTGINLVAPVFSGDWDINNFQVKEFRVENFPGAASFPAPGNKGRMIFNDGTDELNYDTGNNWVTLGINIDPWTNVLSRANNAKGEDINVNLNQAYEMRVENIDDITDTSRVDLENIFKGPATDTADGAAPTGFTFTKLVEGSSVLREKTQIDTVADVAGSLGGTYFTMSGDNDVNQFYVWFDVDNGSVDPAPGSPFLQSIEVDISANDAADVVAQALSDAVDAIPYFNGNDFNPGNAGRLALNLADSNFYVDTGAGWAQLGSGGWDDVLLVDSSAGATDPDFNNNEALNMRLENLGVDPGAAQVGRIFYNTADAIPKFDTGATIEELVDLNNAQTLTNKSMDGATNTFTNIPDTALAESYLLANGSRALTANWNAGAFSATFNSVEVGSAANTITGLGTIINTGTLTLPTATDTLVGRATTDTLTNKTIDGDDNTLQDIADGSLTESYILANGTRPLTANWNAGAFSITANSVEVGSAANTIDGLSTIINTGTLTLPTATDTLVARATTDTLTNKTIDADLNTITNIEDADIKAGANIARSKIAAGSADHVVINDGAGNLSSEAQLASTRGGTGVSNAGTLTYGANNVTFTTTGVTSLALPEAGTVAHYEDGETNFTIANNQATPASVTGLSFSSASFRSAIVYYDISRKTDTASSEVRAVEGKLHLIYRQEGAAWEIAGHEYFGDHPGVTFSVTGAGQVQYTSTNIAGANYVGDLNFRSKTFDI